MERRLRRALLLFLRGSLRLELLQLVPDEGYVLNIKKGDVNDDADDQEGARTLHILEHACVQRLAANRFNNAQNNMPAVENWNREHINNGKVHI